MKGGRIQATKSNRVSLGPTIDNPTKINTTIKNAIHDINAYTEKSELPYDLRKQISYLCDNLQKDGMTKENMHEIEIIEKEVSHFTKCQEMKAQLEILKDKPQGLLRPTVIQEMVEIIKESPTIDETVKEGGLQILNDVISIHGDVSKDVQLEIIDFVEMIIEDEQADETQAETLNELRDITNEHVEVIRDEMDIEKDVYYKDYIASKVKNKEWLNKQFIHKIHQLPTQPKAGFKTRFRATKKDAIHQIDILFLPADNQFKYLLVICDVYSALIDAQPMRTKTADIVLSSIKKIYNRDILKQPHRFVCDSGGEFKSVFKQYCDENGIALTALESGRHIGMVDSKIKLIGNAIMKNQTAQELLTKKQKTAWVEDIDEIIQLINKYTSKFETEHAVYPFDKNGEVADVKFNDKEPIIPINTKVRKILFRPQNALGERLQNGFRAADIRFNPKESIITNIILTPDAPVMYQLDNETQPLTRHQFQLIENDEEMPDVKVLKGKKTYLKEFEEELKKKKK